MIKRSIATLSLAGVLMALNVPAQATEHTPRWQITAETGPVWTSRNDTRIPNDNDGDRFDLRQLTSSGPDGYLRVNLEYQWRERHSVTALFAPLQIDGRGHLPEDTRFAGETFSSAAPVAARFRFNTYRLGWRYHWIDNADWRVRVGATLLVRDAEIRLRQGATRANDDDLGLVPLLSLQATRRWGQQWAVDLDIEGLGAPQGRAIDAALALEYSLTPQLTGRLGYRTLEGGADNDSVLTKSWVHFGLLGLRYRF